MGLPRTLCAYIFIRFERIIHSIWADFAPQKPLSSRLYTMPCALSQKRRACALRTQVRFPTEWKRKTKPEFYLERFLWTVRMRRIRLEHFMVSFGCLLTFTLSSLHAIFRALFITLKDFVHLMSTIINHEHIIQQLLNSVATHPLINLLIHLIHWPTKCKQARTSKALNKLLIPQ